MKVVDIFPKLYIGFQTNSVYNHLTREWSHEESKGLDTEKFPLAFATPFDKDDAAFKKRKLTVDEWSRNTYAKDVPEPKSVYITNDEQTGFQIYDFESRWTTSNKWFCVKDPRGFHLQISAANLIDILMDTDVKKGGYIQGPCVWGRRAAQNVLVPVESEHYKEWKQSTTQNLTSYDVGDEVVIRNDVYIYVGKFSKIQINAERGRRWDRWSYTNAPNKDRVNVYNPFHSSIYDMRASWTPNINVPREFDILVKYHVTRSKEVYLYQKGNDIIEYKSKPKVKRIIGPTTKKYKVLSDLNGPYELGKELILNKWVGYIRYFNTVDEMVDFDALNIIDQHPVMYLASPNFVVEKCPNGRENTYIDVQYEPLYKNDERIDLNG